MKQKNQTTVFGILAFVLGIALIIGAVFFGAYTLTMLWGWFVAPLGVKAIGMAHALGLSLFVGYFKGKSLVGEKPDDIPAVEWAAQKIVELYVGISVILMFGWIYQCYM